MRLLLLYSSPGFGKGSRPMGLVGGNALALLRMDRVAGIDIEREKGAQ